MGHRKSGEETPKREAMRACNRCNRERWWVVGICNWCGCPEFRNVEGPPNPADDPILWTNERPIQQTFEWEEEP